MNEWVGMQVFVHVAEKRSFTKAARAMGMSKASASKHVAALEEVVGRRLLERTTQKVKLTVEGAIYLDAVRQARECLHQATLQMGALHQSQQQVSVAAGDEAATAIAA